MGGLGSGRVRWSDRLTVEDCISLSITQLFRDRVAGPWSGGGTLSWRHYKTGRENYSVGFWVDAENDEGIILHLKYTVTLKDVKKDIKESIILTYTRPHFGGKRWWFLCPLKLNGTNCHRRVGRLYLPPGSRYWCEDPALRSSNTGGAQYFGCRECYNLTYQSCQESHKFEIDSSHYKYR
jgi:hypothetical protein